MDLSLAQMAMPLFIAVSVVVAVACLFFHSPLVVKVSRLTVDDSALSVANRPVYTRRAIWCWIFIDACPRYGLRIFCWAWTRPRDSQTPSRTCARAHRARTESAC